MFNRAYLMISVILLSFIIVKTVLVIIFEEVGDNSVNNKCLCYINKVLT